MSELPTGAITFLFTDIEGSTQLWEQYPEAMRASLARHDACLRTAIEAHHGHVFKTIGDAFCAVFAQAADALQAAIAAQQNLRASVGAGGAVGAPLVGPLREVGALPVGALPEAEGPPREAGPPQGVPLRVRIALHTGAAETREGDYFGPALNRVARLLAVAHGGQVLLSQSTQDLVKHDLPPGVSLRDLGLRRLRDLRRLEHVYQLLHPDLFADFPPLKSLDALSHNLPQPVTSFVGRDQEMAQVNRLLATTRLLTLTGPGGTGKTRLALEVAAALVGRYEDGAWLVELAALADPALVPQAVAAALAVQEERGKPLTQTLVENLQPRDLLLILDNCEHLLAPGPGPAPEGSPLRETPAPEVGGCASLVHTLVRSCPHLRILATSRERLNIPGEQTYPVPSLSAPDPRDLPPTLGGADLVSALTRFEAVRLFLDRAHLAQPSFAITSQNAPFVAHVCHQLDGIPLLLELAAARLRVLSAEQIARRLDDRLRLLTGGSRTALPRQQTLRATMDWSYDLLSEAELRLFRRLSVFAGRFTLEAVETVCAGEGTEREEVLDLLGRLVDKSLVVVEEQEGGARYRLLETIREYGREKLRGSAEEALFRGRHAAYYLALVERAEPALNSAAQGEWLDRLEWEHDNLRAALDWAATSRDVDVGLRLGGALWLFWEVRGYRAEGRERLAGLLALAEGAPPESGGPGRAAARAKALQGLGTFACWFGDYGAARSLQEAAVATRRQLGDAGPLADSLIALAVVAYFQGDYGAARSALEESLTIGRALGDKRAVAASLRHLADVTCAQGEYAPARALFEQTLTIQTELGDRRGIASSLSGLGWVAREQGDMEAARSLLEQSLAINRELNARSGVAYALNSLGETCYLQGDLPAARLCLEESLGTWRELSDKAGIVWSLHGLGVVADLRGDYGEAQSLHEQSLAMRRELGDKWAIADSLNSLGRVARHQGDGERAAALCREGLTLAWQQGNKRCIAECLEGVAAAALETGTITAAAAGPVSCNRSPVTSAARAARLFGAAASLRDTIGSPLPLANRADHDRSLAAARAVLGEAAFATAWAEGRAMPLEPAVEYALEGG